MGLLAGVAERSLPTGSGWDLSRLLHPYPADTFATDHFELEPLHIQRGDPRYYASLLTLDDLDSLLDGSIVRDDGNVVVLAEGRKVPVSGLCPPRRAWNRQATGLEELYARYRGGDTVVLNSLQDRWAPLRRLCEALAAESGFGYQANLYLTPAGSRGFRAHYDTHDVFVVQVHGSKRWRLYGSPVELPLPTQPWAEGTDPGPPRQQIDLHAGDLLYLPRGQVHDATAGGTASAHVTIGMHPPSWAAVVTDAVTRVLADDVRFRRALPFGFTGDGEQRLRAQAAADDLLDLLREGLSGTEIVDRTAEAVLLDRRPALRHHLTDLEAVEGVELSTWLRSRPGLRAFVRVDEDAIGLEFHGKVVRLPARVGTEVRFLANGAHERFRAADLPGHLDGPGRLVLVRTLLTEGFLTLSDDPPASAG